MNPVALLVVIIACAVIIAGLGVYLRERAGNGEPEFDYTIPASHFMPYSVCPECNHEGLHWITKPDLDRVRRTLERLNRLIDNHNERCRLHAARRWLPPPSLAVFSDGDRVAIEVGNGADVIRTCRECEHEWGQEVGPLLKMAA